MSTADEVGGRLKAESAFERVQETMYPCKELRRKLADMTTACEGWCKVAEKAEVDRDAARDLLMDARAYYDRYMEMENSASLHKPRWYVESNR